MIAPIPYLCLHRASAVTIDEDIDMTANGLPSDSFMSLEIGMSDHSNDAASLCPPQRVYISQRLPY